MNEEITEPKEKVNGTVITLMIVVSVIILSYLIIIQFKNNSYQFNETETRCIANHSLLYTQTGCVHCDRQKEMFGNYSKYLNSIDCLDELQKCADNEIFITPTWIINENRYEGLQKANKLKDLTKC